MAEKQNKSVLEEAAIDMMKISEAATKKAKDELAKIMPERFDEILKEGIKNIDNKESVKNQESVNGKTKEPNMVNESTDNANESVVEEDIRDLSMNEIEEAYDDAKANDEFQIAEYDDQPAPEGGDINLNDIELVLSRMGDKVEEIDYVGETQEVTDPYTKFKSLYEEMGNMVQQMEDQKMHEEYGAQFDTQLSGLYGEGYKETIGEEQYNSLYEMFIAHKKGEPFETKAPAVVEMHEKGAQTADPEKGHNLSPQGIREEEVPEPEEVVEAEDVVENEVVTEVETPEETEEERKDEEKVDEVLTNTNAAQRKVQGGHSPNLDVAGKHREPRTRPSQRSGSLGENYTKRLTTLIEENKKLTKTNNKRVGEITKADQVLGKYGAALEKYRTQLQEMAVFNTNLSHVNNIFLNEDLALTNEDKALIIETFKNVGSVEESKQAYKKFISGMNANKKTLTEEVEQKVNENVVDSSSANLMENVVEKTAFKNEHLDKIRKTMYYERQK